ncbi:MAG: PD-(D/E)XK nuclease family protein, partial [Armatimonadetes bacterium]|nr:PD-(D/E)XK nuclease family protein [Armatimonadota bacterium]
GPCLASLPITALDDYANCPKHFEFGHLCGNPGLGPTISERPGYATRIGDLVHRALQEGLRGVAELARLDPLLPQDRLAEAAGLVEGFHETLEFAPFRNAIARELPVRWTDGSGLGVELRGTADLVGDDWVLDYKTGRHASKERHRFQLWAYAQALGVSQAYVADLRAARLLHYPAEELATAGQEAAALLAEMQAGRFEPRPDAQRCQACEYRQLCPAATPAEPAPTAI